jgi:hypothetical protein
MAQAVTRLFDNHDDAAQAVRELKAAGVNDDSISLIASNAEGAHRHDDDDDDNDAAEGAAKGATTGGLLGGGAGLLAGLGMLAIPGLGPVVAAGWLISTIAGAAAGAVAGAATGGILGALKDAGHSEEDAHVYAEGVRRGGTLVSVRAETESERSTAEQVLQGRGGIDALQRGQAYREAGWARFDETSRPYSADEIAVERSRYTESRSFRGGDPDIDPSGSEAAEPTIRPVDPTLRGGV